MPVWTESWGERSGSTDVNGGQELSRVFTVDLEDDKAYWSAAEVIAWLAVNGVVFKGQRHPNYWPCKCTKVAAAVHADDPLIWDVTAQYTEPRLLPGQAPGYPTSPPGLPAGFPAQPAPPQPPPGQSQGTNPTPDQRPPVIVWRGNKVPKASETDTNGKPSLNPAGDPFDPPRTRIDNGMVITNTRYFYVCSAFAMVHMLDKVNSDTWNNFPPHSLLITDVSGDPHTEGDWTGWKVTWTIEYKPDPAATDLVLSAGHIPTRVLNRGWNYIEPKRDAGGNLVEDEDGNQVYDRISAQDVFQNGLSAPVLLNPDGTLANPGDASYTEFVDYREISFAGL